MELLILIYTDPTRRYWETSCVSWSDPVSIEWSIELGIQCFNVQNIFLMCMHVLYRYSSWHAVICLYFIVKYFHVMLEHKRLVWIFLMSISVACAVTQWSVIVTPEVTMAGMLWQNYQAIWYMCTRAMSFRCYFKPLPRFSSMYRLIIVHFPKCVKVHLLVLWKKILWKIFSNVWACPKIFKHENDLKQNLRDKNGVSYMYGIYYMYGTCMIV